MIHLVVALPAEARPLIAHYGLRRRAANTLFPIYEGADVRLVVSGPGKLAGAAAVGYLCASGACDNGRAVWVNVGVAGHRHHPLGAGFLVHSIEEQETGRRWYPPRVIPGGYASESLITVSTPETGYLEGGLYDMEGAGFYATATRSATGELVQCYKVVSDNALAPAQRVHARQVEALIAEQVSAVASLVAALDGLQREGHELESVSAALEGFLAHWRFSASERHRLAGLLRRHAALMPDRPLEAGNFRFCRGGPQVLQALEERLSRLTAPGLEVSG